MSIQYTGNKVYVHKMYGIVVNVTHMENKVKVYMFHIKILIQKLAEGFKARSIYIYNSLYSYKIYLWVNKCIYLKYLICLSK